MPIMTKTAHKTVDLPDTLQPERIGNLKKNINEIKEKYAIFGDIFSL